MTTQPAAPTLNGPSTRPGPDLHPRDAQSLVASGRACIVDVREAAEFAAGHIDGAFHIPLSRFDTGAIVRLEAQRVILQCKSGRRSAEALNRCLNAGIDASRLSNLAGGIEAWQAAGLPVARHEGAPDPKPARAEPSASVMRQVQGTLGFILLGAAALTYFVNVMWVGLAAFIGLGLLNAAITGRCPLAGLIGLLPWNRAAAPCACASDKCCH